MGNESDQWLILWCKEDESYSLIPTQEAVFDEETLSVGDTVRFFYGKKEYSGDVAVIGADDEYDDLVNQLNELNSKNKKARVSFHEDRPRTTRGKGKFQQALQDLKPRRTGAKQTQPPAAGAKRGLSGASSSKPSSAAKIPAKKKAKPDTPLSQLLQEVEDEETSEIDGSDGSNDSNDEDSSDSRSSPTFESMSMANQKESKKTKQKLSTRGKESDLRILHGFVNKPTRNNKSGEGGRCRSPRSENVMDTLNDVDSQSSGTPSGMEQPSNAKSDLSMYQIQSPKSSGNKSGPDKRREPVFGVKTPQLSSESSSGSNLNDDKAIETFIDSEAEEEIDTPASKKQQSKSKKLKERKKQDDEQGLLEQQGEEDQGENKSFSMHRYCSKDADIIKIQGGSKTLSDKFFFISNDNLKKAKSASNATCFAKSLLVFAFTDEALLTRTVSGGQYRAGGKANITQKEALDNDTIDIIIDAALRRQTSKQWKPEQPKKEILAALRQKLVDVRPSIRAKQEKAKQEKVLAESQAKAGKDGSEKRREQ